MFIPNVDLAHFGGFNFAALCFIVCFFVLVFCCCCILEGAQNNDFFLIETVLLSTHNKCFGLLKRKLF